MRIPALILAVLIGLALGQGLAAAEKVKTNQPTKLFNRPGEQAKVLLQVKPGVSMTLLAKDGRWLKVRVHGRTGYVPRSKVDMADDEDIARNTRRRPFVDGRGKKRGDNDSAPDDRVGADALGDNDAGDTSSSSSRSGDDDEDEKPAKTASKSKTKSHDDEDEKPAKTASKSKAKSHDDDDGDGDDDEDDSSAKSKVAAKATKETPKVAAKTPPKTAAKSTDDDDDGDGDEDEDDSKGKAKAAVAVKPAVTTKVATAPTKTAKSDDDDDDDGDEDEDDSKTKVAAKTKSGESDEASEKSERRPHGRVTKRVSAYTDPDAESDEKFVARSTDTLFLGETKGDFTYVENASGESGWVQSDLLESDDDESASEGGGGRSIAVRARGGVLLVKQNIRSTASAVQVPPDNYDVKARMLSVSLGGGIVMPKGKFLVGGELTYDLAKGSVPYEGAGDTSLTLHDVNVRALGGIDFKMPSGMTLLGHLGYRYQAILVASVDNPMSNPAQLPSEVVKGPTIGAELGIARLTNKLGLAVSLDAMLFGAGITQTEGLEDGSSPSIKAIVLGAGLAYHLASLDVLARYELDYMGIDFGAPVASSERMHMGTDVKRTDVFHGITVGVSKPF